MADTLNTKRIEYYVVNMVWKDYHTLNDSFAVDSPETALAMIDAEYPANKPYLLELPHGRRWEIRNEYNYYNRRKTPIATIYKVTLLIRSKPTQLRVVK
jgi:hypothetical protein